MSASPYSPRTRRRGRVPVADGRTALQFGHSCAPGGTVDLQTGHVGPCGLAISPYGKRALHALHTKCVGFVAPQSSQAIWGSTCSKRSRTTVELHDWHTESGRSFPKQRGQSPRSATRGTYSTSRRARSRNVRASSNRGLNSSAFSKQRTDAFGRPDSRG